MFLIWNKSKSCKFKKLENYFITIIFHIKILLKKKYTKLSFIFKFISIFLKLLDWFL